jgi:hypothetical protein
MFPILEFARNISTVQKASVTSCKVVETYVMENQLNNLSIYLFSLLFYRSLKPGLGLGLFYHCCPELTPQSRQPPVLDLQYFQIYFVSIKSSAIWSTLASCPFWPSNGQYYEVLLVPRHRLWLLDQ